MRRQGRQRRRGRHAGETSAGSWQVKAHDPTNRLAGHDGWVLLGTGWPTLGDACAATGLSCQQWAGTDRRRSSRWSLDSSRLPARVTAAVHHRSYPERARWARRRGRSLPDAQRAKVLFSSRGGLGRPDASGDGRAGVCDASERDGREEAGGNPARSRHCHRGV